MGRPSTYAPEVCERAVRMVQEHAAEYPSHWAATGSGPFERDDPNQTGLAQVTKGAPTGIGPPADVDRVDVAVWRIVDRPEIVAVERSPSFGGGRESAC